MVITLLTLKRRPLFYQHYVRLMLLSISRLEFTKCEGEFTIDEMQEKYTFTLNTEAHHTSLMNVDDVAVSLFRIKGSVCEL